MFILIAVQINSRGRWKRQRRRACLGYRA